MAPPSTKPVLAKLDPNALGTAVSELVVEHASRLARRVGHTLRRAGPSDLELTVADLARYAQSGEGDPDDVPDQVQDVVQALYSTPAEVPDADLAQDADAQTPVGLAIIAAVARADIEHGEEIGTAGLAALASLSTRAVQMLVADGELRAESGRVEAAEASRWLSGRGVPGFDAKKKRRR